MATQTTECEYLPQLSGISRGESEAGVYFEAWANATSDEDLACTLRLIAARERSHGEAFCRRISELGFCLEPKADPEAAHRLARYANPKISDLDKIGPPDPEGRDRTMQFFADAEKKMAEGYYDALTCNMMQWYITEERDSIKRLAEAYAAVRAKAAPPAAPAKAAASAMSPSADAEAIMACMTAGFRTLEKSLERLVAAR